MTQSKGRFQINPGPLKIVPQAQRDMWTRKSEYVPLFRIGNVFQCTDPRGGPEFVIVDLCDDVEHVLVENTTRPFRRRKIKADRLDSSRYALIKIGER